MASESLSYDQQLLQEYANADWLEGLDEQQRLTVIRYALTSEGGGLSLRFDLDRAQQLAEQARSVAASGAYQQLQAEGAATQNIVTDMQTLQRRRDTSLYTPRARLLDPLPRLGATAEESNARRRAGIAGSNVTGGLGLLGAAPSRSAALLGMSMLSPTGGSKTLLGQ